MGNVGAAQALTLLGSLVFMLPKSTAAKAGLVSVVGILIVHSDVS